MLEPRILLVSSDLLAGSRLAGLARGAGARLDQRGTAGADDGPYDLVLLDLQGRLGPLDSLVVAARSAVAGDAGGRRGRVVAFGPHVAGDRLREAVEAGCDEAVSRGELLGGFAPLLRRWLA